MTIERTILKQVRKRSGRTVPFDLTKIADAIFKAAQAVGGADQELAEELSDVVVMFLEKQYGADGIPTIEEIQDMVEKVLIETGHAKTAKAYILYRERRSRIREMVQVRKKLVAQNTSTDISLMVDPTTRDEMRPWNKDLIAVALEKEADVPQAIERSKAWLANRGTKDRALAARQRLVEESDDPLEFMLSVIQRYGRHA